MLEGKADIAFADTHVANYLLAEPQYESLSVTTITSFFNSMSIGVSRNAVWKAVEALRAEGFECVVTGGSLFASAPEVRVVARFVEALANPANTAALFEVLTSDMDASVGRRPPRADHRGGS